MFVEARELLVKPGCSTEELSEVTEVQVCEKKYQLFMFKVGGHLLQLKSLLHVLLLFLI